MYDSLKQASKQASKHKTLLATFLVIVFLFPCPSWANRYNHVQCLAPSTQTEKVKSGIKAVQRQPALLKNLAAQNKDAPADLLFGDPVDVNGREGTVVEKSKDGRMVRVDFGDGEIKQYDLRYAKITRRVSNGTKQVAVQQVRQASTALAKDTERPLDNVYERCLQRLLNGTEVTDASRQRRRVLAKIGPAATKIVQDALHVKTVKIAITPIGSTLRGYASNSSDIEYQMMILRGLDVGYVVDKDSEDEIFNGVSALIKAKGFRPEPLQGVITEVINMCAYDSERNIDDYMICNLAALFSPMAYGAPSLIENARRNAIYSVLKNPSPVFLWHSVRDAYLDRVCYDKKNFTPEVLFGKPHFLAWIRAQGGDIKSASAITALLNRRASLIGLPDLSDMQRIYCSGTADDSFRAVSRRNPQRSSRTDTSL